MFSPVTGFMANNRQNDAILLDRYMDKRRFPILKVNLQWNDEHVVGWRDIQIKGRIKLLLLMSYCHLLAEVALVCSG